MTTRKTGAEPKTKTDQSTRKRPLETPDDYTVYLPMDGIKLSAPWRLDSYGDAAVARAGVHASARGQGKRLHDGTGARRRCGDRDPSGLPRAHQEHCRSPSGEMRHQDTWANQIQIQTIRNRDGTLRSALLRLVYACCFPMRMALTKQRPRFARQPATNDGM